MIEITHHRKKCIGCGYCLEVAPSQWTMNETDGKSNLIGSKNKGEIYTLKTEDIFFFENNEAVELCPVNVIQIKRL